MPKVKLTCRVCGKHYEACNTKIAGVYKWTDIACSHECFDRWLELIKASRDVEHLDHKK